MLVASGKTLQLQEKLLNQGLKPGTTVMILRINPKDSSWSTAMVRIISSSIWHRV